MSKCVKCDGCGQVANDDDQLPWSYWKELPLQSAVAVLVGLVQPITCPECNGTGEAKGTPCLTEIMSAADAAEKQVAEAVAYINGPDVGGTGGRLYVGEIDDASDDNGNGPAFLFLGPHDEDDSCDGVAWSSEFNRWKVPPGLKALFTMYADSTVTIPTLVAGLRELAAEVERKDELMTRAIVALHMFNRSTGTHRNNFDECRENLCGDWHELHPEGMKT